MQYSPKLKVAIAQIQEILKEHNVAGMIVLHTPGFCEYLNFIEPDYSCASWDHIGGGLKLKAKLKHFDGDAQRRNQRVADTLNMLRSLSVVGMQQGLNIAEISAWADKTYGADHNEGDHTSHIEQNN
ncbi:MAG: hypothetical protein JSS76_08330 [Bacteroidetes bacterium]|nr:hypothetical protein [Bacteroidota bacterium]